jgi:signal peptidase II
MLPRGCHPEVRVRAVQKAAVIVLVLCLCVGCDQVTKTVAKNHLAVSQPVHLMGDVLRFQYTENTGAFLGLGASLSRPVRFWSLIVFVSVILVGVLRFIWTSPEMTLVGIVGGSLVVGGGLSNLLDRLFNDGAVVDFMNVGVRNLRTGVFNVADLATMIGVGLLLGSVLLSDLRKGSTPDERVG